MYGPGDGLSDNSWQKKSPFSHEGWPSFLTEQYADHACDITYS